MSDDLYPPTIDELVAEARRELKQRQRVYPRLIAKKKMTHHIANRQIALQAAIIEKLEQLKAEGGRA